jgi:hypothetical protein
VLRYDGPLCRLCSFEPNGVDDLLRYLATLGSFLLFITLLHI